jgi:hypothetical protein
MHYPIKYKHGHKLSTKQRHDLPASAFCGPNRSFPVPDMAHVGPARAFINRAHLSASERAQVLACVARKEMQFKKEAK